jgi:hypothetical protein
VAVLAGVASFAIFRSQGLGLCIATAVVCFTAWLDEVRHTMARQMAELAMARAYLQKGEETAAGRISLDLAGRARARRVRNGALATVAWVALKEGHPERAKEALEHIQPGNQIDLYCFAIVERALGKTWLAIEALELEPAPSCESAMFLVDLYVLQKRFDRAVAAAAARRQVLGVENCRKVRKAAVDAWELDAAARIAVPLLDDTGSLEDAGAWFRILAYQRQFEALDQSIKDFGGRLWAQGKRSEVRALLAELAADSTLPSGACREIQEKLRALDSE